MEKEDINIVCKAGIPIASVEKGLARRAQGQQNYICESRCNNGAACLAAKRGTAIVRADLALIMRGRLISPPLPSTPGSTTQT